MKYNAVANDNARITISITILLLALMSACSGSGSDSFTGAAGDASNTPVSLTITSPAAGGTSETPDATVSLAGTAGSNTAIASVTWVSDKGGQGEASGTESWRTGTIPLQIGENTITVTAKDSAGATASRTVVIKREGELPGSVTLAWQAPTRREDGTPLTDLAGYHIHYGRMSETYDYEIKIGNPGVVSYVVENLNSGTWYFVASAYDSAGRESNFSNEISKDVP